MICRNVDDLPEASRQGIELLLGAPLEAHQRVYIVVDASPVGPGQPARTLAAKRIREIIAQAKANAESQGVSDQEIDAAIQEAMQAVRPRS